MATTLAPRAKVAVLGDGRGGHPTLASQGHAAPTGPIESPHLGQAPATQPVVTTDVALPWALEREGVGERDPRLANVRADRERWYRDDRSGDTVWVTRGRPRP